MRTVTAVLLVVAGVLGLSAAVARPSPETESGACTCREPPAQPAATGGGPSARESSRAGSANARLAPPTAPPSAPATERSLPAPPRPAVSTPPSPTPGPTPGPTLYTMTGQRYGQSNVVAVPTVMVPASTGTVVAPQQAGGFGPYGVSPQAMLPPLLSPPPVVISDGPSPTLGGGGGFMLPVPGANPTGTLTNPYAQ